jgi:hypothetical protein
MPEDALHHLHITARATQRTNFTSSGEVVQQMRPNDTGSPGYELHGGKLPGAWALAGVRRYPVAVSPVAGTGSSGPVIFGHLLQDTAGAGDHGEGIHR